MILSNSEITTHGFTLCFDERINMNMSEYTSLGIRKIKYEIAENPGYSFALEVMYYDRSNDGTDMNLFKFILNLTTQKPSEIGNEIVGKLQAFFVSKNKTHIVSTMDYEIAFIFIGVMQVIQQLLLNLGWLMIIPLIIFHFMEEEVVLIKML
jgi:hypothetical protein